MMLGKEQGTKNLEQAGISHLIVLRRRGSPSRLELSSYLPAEVRERDVNRHFVS